MATSTGCSRAGGLSSCVVLPAISRKTASSAGSRAASKWDHALSATALSSPRRCGKRSEPDQYPHQVPRALPPVCAGSASGTCGRLFPDKSAGPVHDARTARPAQLPSPHPLDTEGAGLDRLLAKRGRTYEVSGTPALRRASRKRSWSSMFL